MIQTHSLILLLLGSLLLSACRPTPASETAVSDNAPFPSELVDFAPYKDNPIFTGTGADTWDQHIRERGYILREDGDWHMWYTGYRDEPEAAMALGYATSPDGLNWTRYAGNPIFSANWTEDMMVLKVGETYYLFAEGRNDIAHLLTSTDRINWTEMGPEPYDQYGLAVNQLIEYEGRYYVYYHGTAYEDWRLWSTHIAMSEDLIHWTKYPGNPLLEDNKSSGILLHDGTGFRLYTMHEKVQVHFPTTDSTQRP